MASCRWCFTVNNPKDTDHVTLSTLDCKYMIYAEETALTTGTLHLQGYVVLSSPCRLSKMKKILPPGTHIEAAKGTTEQNIEYCSKEGWPVEYGTRPKTRAQIGEDNAARYADAIQAAKEGRMDDIPQTCEPNITIHTKILPRIICPSRTPSPRRVDYGSMARLEPERPMPW